MDYTDWQTKTLMSDLALYNKKKIYFIPHLFGLNVRMK